MRGKETHVAFGAEHLAETAALHQYDYGQVLVFDDITLPSTFEVLFQNGIIKQAKTAIGTNNSVLIPDEYLLSGHDIMAWLFLHEDSEDGEVEYTVQIPVKPRSKLSPDDITPEEHSIISDLIAAVDDVADQVTEISTGISRILERIVALEGRIPALGGWKDGGV